MKKPIKKNWLKALIISFSLLLINCSVEEEVISGSHFGPQNKKFTYSDFLKETKVKDFDIFAQYNVSRTENGALNRSIQQDFITDTTEIKRLEIPNTEKTTYSFKLYPLSEQLNSKEYYNMVVEKNGNQLTYMVFFNKDKENPAPNEIKTETSQMVFNSRSPHSGFIEVITHTIRCNGSCRPGVCDGFACPTGECIHTTVSYLYISANSGSTGSGSGGSGTGGSGGGGGGGSPLDGFYIPNPYDGIDMNDPTNSALALSFQINTFFNTLSPELKEIAKKHVNFAFAFQYFNIHGFDDATKQHYVTALTNYKNFIDATANTRVNTDAQAKLEYWAFQTFLNNNENGLNNTKINNIKNYLINPNVDFLTKEKIIDELATKNNQEVLDFVNELIDYLINNPSMTWEIVMNNRTSFDTNEGEVDNYTSGGYDTTTYPTFNPQQQTWPSISPVIPQNKFVGWNRASHPNWHCMDYSKEQLRVMGYQISSYYSAGQTFQIYTAQNGVNNNALSQGLSYLKHALSNGIPVIVGVDDAPGHPRNLDNTTDHFIVIVGMGTDSNGKYFQFYDNASGLSSQGASSLNKLYYNSATGIISGSSQCIDYVNTTSYPYKVTMIRKSKSL